MVIEIPKITDHEQINNLAIQVHKIHVNWRSDVFLDVSEVINKKELEERIQNKEIIVAKLENTIVGYATFNIKENENPIMKYAKILKIEAICVDKNNRCKGIGTKLLEHIKNIAKENNCTQICLTVNEENIQAIKVYEKFGFKVRNISYSMNI